MTPEFEGLIKRDEVRDIRASRTIECLYMIEYGINESMRYVIGYCSRNLDAFELLHESLAA